MSDENVNNVNASISGCIASNADYIINIYQIICLVNNMRELVRCIAQNKDTKYYNAWERKLEQNMSIDIPGKATDKLDLSVLENNMQSLVIGILYLKPRWNH